MDDSIYSHITDCHCHTEYAYCGAGITAHDAISRSKQAGLRGLCLTEHAPQLYVPADDFWEVRHINEMTWRDNPASRMTGYKAFMDTLRDDFVLAGFEVELDAEDQLTITDEDRQWADIIIGAIHWLPGEPMDMTYGEFVDNFMATNSKILEGGVDILAHPFRLFHSRKHKVDKSLYADLAAMLAETDTAAEINLHHTSRPDPNFYAICIDRGVKISLASDSHVVENVANFTEHIQLIRDAAGKQDITDLLYTPKAFNK